MSNEKICVYFLDFYSLNKRIKRQRRNEFAKGQTFFTHVCFSSKVNCKCCPEKAARKSQIVGLMFYFCYWSFEVFFK
jgi:hypothetical protein